MTGTPADLISYQNELVRTKNYTSLGRANKIAIGPSADWMAPPVGQDPFIDRFGRLIDLRSRFLPIAMSPDKSILLITAPLLHRDGSVGLPDVPDPSWEPSAWTQDEITVTVPRDPAKDQPRMLPQRLEDRCERPQGRLGVLEGTNFLVFQPVLRIAYQPEILQDGRPQLQAAMWTIECDFDQATQTHVALLVDARTGESHFFGGRYDIVPTE